MIDGTPTTPKLSTVIIYAFYTKMKDPLVTTNEKKVFPNKLSLKIISTSNHHLECT